MEVAVDARHGCQAHAFGIHDCAAGFEEVAGLSTASGEAGIGEFLVLDDEVLQHTVVGGDFVEGGEVDFAELFDVYGTAVLG